VAENKGKADARHIAEGGKKSGLMHEEDTSALQNFGNV
jgi:hypothetical protein